MSRRLRPSPSDGARRRVTLFVACIMVAVGSQMRLLMNVFNLAVAKELELRAIMPDTVPPKEPVEYEDVFLTINAAGVLALDDDAVTAGSLKDALRQLQARCAPRPPRVTLEAEPKAPYGAVVECMDTLSAVGITSVTFVIAEESL
jgi:biopolymer transport protein ExbD